MGVLATRSAHAWPSAQPHHYVCLASTKIVVTMLACHLHNSGMCFHLARTNISVKSQQPIRKLAFEAIAARPVELEKEIWLSSSMKLKIPLFKHQHLLLNVFLSNKSTMAIGFCSAPFLHSMKLNVKINCKGNFYFIYTKRQKMVCEC